MQIHVSNSDSEIADCYPVFKVLRPHLVEADFVARVRRQQAQGYRICSVRDSHRVLAAAGYRVLEFLAWGTVLYVDDLITAPDARGSGCAGALLDWLISHAREHGCDQLHLDSGYQRHDAHRLYLKKGLHLDCHHFAIDLKPERKTV